MGVDFSDDEVVVSISEALDLLVDVDESIFWGGACSPACEVVQDVELVSV